MELESPPDKTPPLRVVTYDLEVQQGGSGPPVVSEEGTEQARNPITAISAHDSYTDEYRAWILKHDSWGATESQAAREAVDAAVGVYANPREIAGLFCEWVVERNADALVGWNACIPSEADVQMANGKEKKMENVEVGDEVIGIDGESPSVATVTEKVKTKKERVDLQLESEGKISYSSEHKVMVGTENGISWKRVENIKSGEYVLHPHELPVKETHVPKLKELIPLERQRYTSDDVSEIRSRVDSNDMEDIADVFGVALGTVQHNHIGTWTPERVSRISDEFGLNTLPNDTYYQRLGNYLNREITEDEMYLAGLIVSDGSMEKNGTIKFYNKREELHDQFPEDNTLYDGKGDGCFAQKVLDASYAWMFNSLGIPFGEKNGSYRDFTTIYQMPKQYIGAFMAGWIDGDGWVNSTINLSVLDDIAQSWVEKLFMRIGICSRSSGKNITVKLSERSYDKIEEFILPHISHSEKERKIESLEPSSEASTETVPKTLVEFEEIDKSARYIYKKGYNLTRRTCNVTDWESWWFDRVESVEYSGEMVNMYDIETTEESFVASNTLVHNSTFDHPYLVNYCLDNGVNSVYTLSPTRDVWDMSGDGSFINSSLKGRLLLDLLTLYKKTQIHELDSYRLEDVANEEDVSVGKLDIEDEISVPDGEPAIDHAWEHHPDVFCEYALRDTQAAVGINRESQKDVHII